jgi:hypothetical protein
MDRYEILQGENNSVFQTATKPYQRDLLGHCLNSLVTDPVLHSRSDQFNIAYLSQDNWEFVSRGTSISKTPLFNTFYNRPGDLASYYSDEFDIQVSPVLYVNRGIGSDNDQNSNRLSRGVVMRGSIDKKVGFYPYFTSSKAFFLTWVNDYTDHNGAVPGEGFWKQNKNGGYSYFSALGQVTFNLTKISKRKWDMTGISLAKASDRSCSLIFPDHLCLSSLR